MQQNLEFSFDYKNEKRHNFAVFLHIKDYPRQFNSFKKKTFIGCLEQNQHCCTPRIDGSNWEQETQYKMSD